MLGINSDEVSQDAKGDWIGPAPCLTTQVPGPKATALIERDEKLSSPSHTRDYPLVAQRAKGSVIEDVDGNRFLDFAAGIAVCSTGHCHPKVVEAIEQQARNLIHLCGCDFYYPSMIELGERLDAIAPGQGPHNVLLTNSGTEAVEATIKMCRSHTKRKWIIAFHGAFHGRTMGSLALTCSKVRQQENFGPLVPMVAHVPYGDVDAIESQLFKYKVPAKEVAAIFVEALQGEGGYIVPDADFLPSLRALCDKHGILLVCDEIQSGAGRTGKWFAFQHFDVVPDIITMAKGLASGMPLGAVIAQKGVMDWEPAAQGSTFGGNPVCCAAANATLELIESAYMANAATLGEKLRAKLTEMSATRKVLANVRGLGLMCGVDIINPRTGKPDAGRREKILKGAFERGLVLLACGDKSIRFSPPLCINETQLDVGMKVLDETLAAVK